MLEHTNHHLKDRPRKINWTLEVEEGWVPHIIFSTHFLNKNKVVIHTCDLVPEFMDNNCSLRQGQFGPEGAIILKQCCHAFHATCIVEHSLRRSVCPECRSPLSSRLYEMMGLRAIMPSRYKYNRWNLLLNQLPMKFMNYRKWGNPLIWDKNFKCHELFHNSGDNIDKRIWDWIAGMSHRAWCIAWVVLSQFRGPLEQVASVTFPIPSKESREIKGWKMTWSGRCRRLWRGV